MDARPAQQPDAGAAMRVQAAIASPPSLWGALAGSPFSFIRPSNVVDLAAWRARRRRPAA